MHNTLEEVQNIYPYNKFYKIAKKIVHQKPDYHPVITTVGNSCKLSEGGRTCCGCDWYFKDKK